MLFLKKITFGLFYLITFFIVLVLAKQLLKSTDVLFTVSWATFFSLLAFVAITILTSLFFVVFITLTQDWKYIAGLLIISNLSCFLLFNSPENIILSIGFLSIGGLTYVLLENKLRSYLTFQPTVLLSAPTLNFARFFMLLFAVLFFFTLTTNFINKPFAVPDNILEFALKLTPQTRDLTSQSADLLKQSGIDPKMLAKSGLNNLTQLPKNTIKNALAQQINQVIAPYQSLLPLLLAFLLFISLTSTLSLLGILVSPLLWLIFWLLEITGFIKFVTEMREVKKLVV